MLRLAGVAAASGSLSPALLLAPACGAATGLLLPAFEAAVELRVLLPTSLVITHCVLLASDLELAREGCALLASDPEPAREGWQVTGVCNGWRLKTTLLMGPTCK
jgi:hypothetical protein